MANDHDANGSKEITLSSSRINILSSKSPGKEITPTQPNLPLGIERDGDFGEIGMGILSDGTPYLNQRGLAALCGVQNAHIGTISSQWTEVDQKPRIKAIKAILAAAGLQSPAAHIEVSHRGQTHFCYPAEICLAVLEYYAFDAGANCQPEARTNFRQLAGSKLRELIYRQLGYDRTGLREQRFDLWHERISLNYQAAPRGFFHVFNEAHTIIYEMIAAGAPIGPEMVVDISIGQHWSRYWEERGLDAHFGPRQRYPHCYPDSHPQSKANPHESWCYPIDALGSFRVWMQDIYVGEGKFAKYLKGVVGRGTLPPSIAELAIAAVMAGPQPPPRLG